MRKFYFLLILCSFFFSCKVSAVNLPYKIDFSVSQEGWTAVDQSEVPGKTWVFKPKAAYIKGSYYAAVMTEIENSSTANDYYVSPAFSLQANKTYVLSSTALKMQGLCVMIGTSSTDMTTYKKLTDILADNDYSYQFEPETVTFTVESDGTYYIAYHGTSEMYVPSPAGYLFGMKLSEVENAPEEVIENVPYSVDFRSGAEGWTVVDNNKDGKSWDLNDYGVAIDNVTAHNDDFVSPKFILQQEKTYTLSSKITLESGNEVLAVLVRCADGTLKELERMALVAGNNEMRVDYSAVADSMSQFVFRIADNIISEKQNLLCLENFEIKEKEVLPDDNSPLISTDFSEENPIQNWTVIDKNEDAVTWNLQNGIQGVTYNAENAGGAADDWLITPELKMMKGHDYLIEFSFKQSAAFGPDSVAVCYGASPKAEDLIHTIAGLSIEEEGGLGHLSYVYRITYADVGNVFIGFHVVTADQNGILTLESLKVTPVEKSRPIAVQDLQVISQYEQKSVTLSWTNSSMDTQDAEIVSPMVAKIYQGEVLVEQLQNMIPGEKVNHTLYPEQFSGKVTYKITLCLGDQESDPAAQSVNLDDFQGDLVLVKSFRDVNKNNSKEWGIEDKAGKFKWAFDYASVFYFNYGGNKDTQENDWLISPCVTLEKGKRYILKYQLKTSRDYASSIDVCLGMEQNSSAMNDVLASHVGLKQNGFGEFETEQFEVAENGEYHVGFHVYDVASAISMRYLEVYSVGTTTGVDVMESSQDVYFDNQTSILFGCEENSLVTIYNLQGEVVEQQRASGVFLNLSLLDDGLYIALIANTDGTQKILKFLK